MHVEILVEDASTDAALQVLLRRMLMGRPDDSWRIVPFRGKARMLERLPGVLRAVAQMPHVDEVLVVIDRDNDDCHALKARIQDVANHATPQGPKGSLLRDHLRIRIAMRELESWFLGDPAAVIAAYPRVTTADLPRIRGQDVDAMTNAWEQLQRPLLKRRYYETRMPKVTVAESIAAHLDLSGCRTKSYSYRLLLQTLRDIYRLSDTCQ